ncbi:BAR/IMD domain-containing adapter protein 2-like 1 [Paramormyrops kingsleyae]|nr:brain-specific angiogenesis inhibitor 1-associated protein 2-like protein 1 [Paramormyrops kingsleyae]XP_023691259.1 brain-specific angiogenesis inhibitor 1-associated protein 2-like protein 1 [Paramormyrops kingsleyae]
MSRNPEEVNKLTESTYKNVMEQFNPGLRNLINLGKNYEKAASAMTLAGKTYFDAVSKIGENAAISPVSRELGVVLMEISEVHRNVHLELEENFRKFHKEILSELERKTDMDVKYMNATFKRYQMEHKIKQDSMEKSQMDLKKLRRKSQGKNATKYESKENECAETLTSRQMEMQNFVADGCKEALLEEKRRFCFLVDKHCTLTYQFSAFHHKAEEMLLQKVQSWQDKCGDATIVPDNIMAVIEGLRIPVSYTPQPSPVMNRSNKNPSDTVTLPPAPPMNANVSPLANMFKPPKGVANDESPAEPAGREEGSLPRSTSLTSGLNLLKRPKVRTIFPHTGEGSETLLSFQEGAIITLLIPDEKDGWLYGELDKNKQRGWFPSSYCQPYTEPSTSTRPDKPARSKSVVNLTELDPSDMLLPPPDYSDATSRAASDPPAPPYPENTESQHNGIAKVPFLAGGNPFITVKLRPTVTNDRSAPVI